MKIEKIALIGNPNSGKTSVFNQLTGLKQRVGNYPGITVDKKSGYYKSQAGERIKVVDLPGVYSIFPKTEDEHVVQKTLLAKDNEDYPDLGIVVVDATNLERNLLLFTQVNDLGIPLVLVLNMSDRLEREGLEIDEIKLSEMLRGIPVCKIDAQKGVGIGELKEVISTYRKSEWHPFIEDSPINPDYRAGSLTEGLRIEDSNHRFKRIRQILNFCQKRNKVSRSQKKISKSIDQIVTHPVWGYLIFLAILFLIFQAIYELANIPMDLIDNVFLVLSQQVGNALPPGILTDLLSEGIIPGVGGVVIFVPQIALLFLFISVLEESGYMSRVVFIMDRLMRPFGLSGKSVVPLISGVACAIPAVMATRTIDQWKERLVTIMVVPLTSCSARLPVYTLLIALVIPDEMIWGIINLKGPGVNGMYLLGFVGAFLVAIVFKFVIKSKQKSFHIMELPVFKWPRANNVGLLIWKIQSICLGSRQSDHGYIDHLWVMASYGPPGRMESAVERFRLEEGATIPEDELDQRISSVRLENSWIGILGKQLEPAITPLGYNWQIGISLITSFAAREVFVGSMATIYSVGEDFEESDTLINRMKNEKDPRSGLPVYNLASGVSLMIFYAFAMQCMSTLAIVRRETKSWKWPLIQLAYMTVLAYFSAWAGYAILS